MYFVFKEFHLPQIPLIDSTLKESAIRRWKGTPEVKNCYNNLFKFAGKKGIEHETFMSKIIQKLRKTKKGITKMQIAYAISVCEILLNPQNLCVHATESTIKPILTKNFVSIYIKEL